MAENHYKRRVQRNHHEDDSPVSTKSAQDKSYGARSRPQEYQRSQDHRESSRRHGRDLDSTTHQSRYQISRRSPYTSGRHGHNSTTSNRVERSRQQAQTNRPGGRSYDSSPSRSPPRTLHRRSSSHSPSRRKYRHTRSRSPSSRHHKRSASPSQLRRRSPRSSHRSHKTSPPPQSSKSLLRSRAPLPTQSQAFGHKPSSAPPDTIVAPIEKQNPNFGLSGALAAETNTVAGIVLKYNEPPESRKPPGSAPWRLYVFKGSETLDTIELATRSCWLFGREASVADYAVEHPSCSKQHAVIQFRYVEKKNEYGDRDGSVRPYIIDLESANGTIVNGEQMPERRFVELKTGDVLGFGQSTREYVLMLPPIG